MAYHQTALPEGSPQVFTTLQTHWTGIGFLPHSISTLPILMARRSHCLRRLTACKAAKRKYPGHVPVPVEPALLHLWHEPDRSLCCIETVFSKRRGHGGPVTQRISLRIRVPFYSVFDLHEGLSEPRATLTRSVLPLISHFIFWPKSVHLTKIFSKFFPSAADRAQLPHGLLSHAPLLPGQYPVSSCQE